MYVKMPARRPLRRGTLGCCGQKKKPLGDSGWIDAVTGQPITDNPIIVAPENPQPPVNPWALPTNAFQPISPTVWNVPIALPSITASNLLKAASLPGAPSAVRAAAAQLGAGASPFSLASISAFLGREAIPGSGITFGLLGGVGGALLLITALKGKRR